MPDELFPDLPPALTDAARQEAARFNERHERLLAPMRTVALSVLVWGKNPNAQTRMSKKRREIREALERRGHNAMFSEGIGCDDTFVSLQTDELAQAKAADRVFV